MVKSRVDDAVSKGAKVLAGGSVQGACYEPTVIVDVPADSDFAKHETFGPVVAVEKVDSPDDAIARANATSYGLSAAIFTGDTDRGFALAQKLESGIAHVNEQSVGDEPQMPFGGVKDSGYGRFGGQAVIDEFTELRWITVQGAAGHPYPF
jgi:aldehyde dehydrogenase (NAD+)